MDQNASLKTADRFVTRLDKLASERSTLDAHCQEIAEYVIPRRSDFINTPPPGSKLTEKVVDSTAIRGGRILSSGLHGSMTAPSSIWFYLCTVEKIEDNDAQAAKWLDDVSRMIFHILNLSNFNSQVHETYIELSAFGTGILYEEPDNDTIVRFDSRPLTECYIVENSKGVVDTIFRKFKYTVSQAYEEWGEKNGETVKKLYKDNKFDDKVDILHVACARRDYKKDIPGKINMPFASFYIDIKDKHMIEEGGYEEFPFFVVRWLKCANEIYGRSPAMDALPDIKMVNEMARTLIKGSQKIVDPPLVLPHNAFILPIKTVPGGLNFRISREPNDRIEPLQTNANIPIGIEMITKVRESINSMFFVDLFLMLTESQQMTATEVLERVKEKMIVLGPTMGRIMTELLNPIINRTYKIAERKGSLPEMPASLKGKAINIRYVSPLAKAQQQQQFTSTVKLGQLVLNIGTIVPDALDTIDWDIYIKEGADALGASKTVLADVDNVAAIRKARGEAQQKSMQEQSALTQSKIAENMAKAAPGVKDLMAGGMMNAGGSPGGMIG